MKISFLTPGGERISFTAPDDATQEDVQAQIDSLQQQYLEHYSPSQYRMKQGLPLVTGDEPVSPITAGKEMFQEGVANIKEAGIYDPTNPANLGKLGQSLIGAAGVASTIPAAVGQQALNMTGSPAFATGANFLSPITPLGVGKIGMGAARLAMGTTVVGASRVGEKLAEMATKRESARVLADAPLAAARPTTPADIGAAVLKDTTPKGAFATLDNEWEDLKKVVFDESPPEPVVTKTGRKGRVKKDLPAEQVEVVGDDGVTTVEPMKEVRVAPAALERLSDEVNKLKPSRDKALHSDMLKPEMGLRPAININGRVITGQLGQRHNDLIKSLPEGQKIFEALLAGKLREADVFGFTDASGQFLSRTFAALSVQSPKIAASEIAARKAATAAKKPKGKKAAPPKTVAEAAGEELPPPPPSAAAPAPAPAAPMAAKPSAVEMLNQEAAKRTAKLAGPKPPPEAPLGWPPEGLPFKTQAELEAVAPTGGPVAPSKQLPPAPGKQLPPVPDYLLPPSAMDEIRAAVPEMKRKARASVRAAYGPEDMLDPMKTQVGDTVSTHRGQGVIENFSAGPDGQLINEVRLANGQLHRTPFIFKKLTEESGAFDPLFVPRMAKAMAKRAVKAAREFNRGQRTMFSPLTVSDESREAGRKLREWLGDTNAWHSKTTHLFRTMDAFFDRFSDTEKVMIYQRIHNGTKQIGPFAQELDDMAKAFRHALSKREATYAQFGKGLHVSEWHVAALFKDQKRGKWFGDLATARNRTIALATEKLKAMTPPERLDIFKRIMNRSAMPDAYWERIVHENPFAEFFTSFKDPQNAWRTWQRFYNGKQGISGTKKAHYDFFAEGLMSELEPITYSPPLLVQSRLYQMDKSILKERILRSMKNDLIAVRRGRNLPDGYTYLDEKAFPEMSHYQTKQMTTKLAPKGSGPLAGPARWALPTDIATIVNNELMPGLRGRPGFAGKVYNFARDVNMLTTMSRLGVSAFHFTDIVLSAPIVEVGQAWKEFFNNEQSLRGFERLRQQGFALGKVAYGATAGLVHHPITYGKLGAATRKEFFEHWGDDPTSAVLNYLIKGNMRLGHDEQYAMHFQRAFEKALHERDYGRAVLHAYPAALEALSKPLFEHLIPNMKIGATVTKIQRILAEMPPGSSQDAIMTRIMTAVDEMDNIFGIVNYDNYHLNKGLKDAMFVLFQAPGWALGSYRQFKGAIGETLEGLSDLAQFKRPKLGDKQAFWLGVGTVHSMATVIMQFALTGTFPEVDPSNKVVTLRNFMTHKTGRMKANGEPERAILPGYHKEAWHLSKAGGHGISGVGDYVLGKTGGAWQDIFRMIRNRDFFGTQIHTGELMDPTTWPRAIGQSAAYLGGANVPISIQAGLKSAEETGGVPYKANRSELQRFGEKLGKLDPSNPKNARDLIGTMLGEVQAPAYITRTPLEQFLYEKRPPREQKVEAAAKASRRWEAINAMKRAKTPQEKIAVEREMAKDKYLTDADRQIIARRAGQSNVERLSEGASAAAMLKGMHYATPEERRELLPLIIKKMQNTERNRTAEETAELEQELAQWLPQKPQRPINAPPR